jgi:bifunctional non-homologous end joining protein LigD
VSRNAHPFRQFAALSEAVRDAVLPATAVLDGEIVCLDATGRPRFGELLFRRGTPCFVAFDVLAVGRRDLRRLPLIERKALLRRVIRPDAGVLYADHCHGRGCELFARVCAEDLEGIVAKAKRGRYDPARVSTWVKIKNRDYSQARDRHELFDRGPRRRR